MLASAGFLMSAGDGTADHESWHKAFSRLKNRNAFPVDRQTFVYRPVELLGVALGSKACSKLTAHDRAWLRSVLQKAEAQYESEYVWDYWLALLASAAAGSPWKAKSFPAVDELSLAELSLLAWLRDHPLTAQIHWPGEVELRRATLSAVFTRENAVAGIAQCTAIDIHARRAMNHVLSDAAAETLTRPRNQATAIDLLSTLCSRFPFCARQLEKRRENRETLRIKDEYDVQDLMHALLKLHFQDVRPEEWCPSYAGTSSRMDFLLKREKIVVETKMTRKGLDQRKVISELAEDIQRYRTHQDCAVLICFVFDPGGFCDKPVALESDLTRESDGLKVVVLVYPKAS